MSVITKTYQIIDVKLAISGYHFCKGFQIHITKEHENWLIVGELIRGIRKPISIYVDEIVKAFHEKLCKDLHSIGKCTNPADCHTKTDDRKLCKSCKCWFKNLETSHEKGKNSSWHKNCKSARWSEDYWEVAKYFMPALGSNLSTVKDAESTDLSSLLNVLEWMKDAAFLGKTRVNVDLVRKLRSQVRNTWAHAPQHELTDDEKAEGFSVATDFLKDLDNVCPNTENCNCLEYLAYLNINGVTNVVECELQSLLFQRHLLDGIKEEIADMRIELSSDQGAIEENLVKLERALKECSEKMSDFENFKENINKQFDNFAEELKSFRGISDDIHEIRDSIGQIRDDLKKINERQKEERNQMSCLPDKLMMFTGRKTEIQKVITFLADEKKAVVSLHGGPGFGKTAIAIEVSHKLSEDHSSLVVFSQLAATTDEDEMIRHLCLDVGVNHEDDPKQSLMLWLKNIKRKVIFVTDDIDNLLRERSTFYEFVRWLRKNSNLHCQIVTTSRTSFEIPDLPTDKIQVDMMDEKACIEFLKKKCPQEEDNFLRKLAKLCGHVPLAMCIAGSRVDDFEDSNELLQHLEKQPMKTLECPESGQYVNRAINMSYEKCSDEEQKTFLRLSVFEGSFSKDAAKAVIEKDNLETIDILKKLVSLSLIKEPTKHRYSIHLLIKHFLKDKQKSGEQKSETALAEGMRAEVLMIEYYLELGHQLTMKSYSKDGYKDNREALKREVSNIQNVLNICSQQQDGTSPNFSDSLARSKIYQTSARLFSIFIRTIIPGPIVHEFLQQCANLAKERGQHAIKMNFDCLLVAEERSKTIGKTRSDEEFIPKMEEIKKEFETHYKDLKEDESLCAYYYYLCGRYLCRKSKSHKGEERLVLLNQAREQLEKSLKLRAGALAGTPEGKADHIFSLLHPGKICRSIGLTEQNLGKTESSETSFRQAEEYYKKAIELSKSHLGDHDLTSWCYKHLGDLFLTIKKHKEAEKEYTTAKTMREKLGLDASEKYVFLLNNLGECLTKSERANEAIKVLGKACDIAENLPESDELNVCKTKVYTSLATAYDLVQNSSKAREYANKALEYRELDRIIQKDELLKILENNMN